MTHVSRMSGAGNSFLVLLVSAAHELGITKDTASMRIPQLVAEYSTSTTPPVEGVVVVDAHSFSFTSDFYNPDGSHGMLCGNGARCAVRFAIDNGTQAENGIIPFTQSGKPYRAFVDQQPWPPNIITIELPPPTSEQHYATGALRDVMCDVYYVHVPSHHVVIDMPEAQMRAVVQKLRHHELFPNGVNVNMVKVEHGGIVNIATFERGVEAITGACGTGAVAAAVSLWRRGLVGDVVTLRPPSGSLLTVTIVHTDQSIKAVHLTGNAQYDS